MRDQVMHKITPALSAEQLNNLLELQSQVKMIPATSHRRRMGANKYNNLSIYNYSRYMTWTAAQRKIFKENFPDNADSKAVVKWFVEYPANTGFLDRMTYWVGEPSPSWFTCYNIKGSGNITINDELIVVPVGQGITFAVSEIHDIAATAAGATWACVMTCDNVWDW
jgi:hypothetical protein